MRWRSGGGGRGGSMATHSREVCGGLGGGGVHNDVLYSQRRFVVFTTKCFAWSDLLLWAFSSRLEMQSPFVDLCHLLGRSVLLPTFKF